jgi:hypothetical protein
MTFIQIFIRSMTSFQHLQSSSSVQILGRILIMFCDLDQKILNIYDQETGAGKVEVAIINRDIPNTSAT